MSGRLLGRRYAIQSRLGEGGMGVVYRARDTMLARTVAVKIFRPGASEIARTTTETRLLAGLNHPALVTLFDAHVDGSEPRYLVMEFVDGETLHSRLERGPLSARSAVRLARSLAEALHVVHEAGIVHRDIKPANVLLRPSNVPGEEFHAKLADFGIAYLVDSTRLTAPGTVVGSAAYLSPEQVTGSTPGPATDIYSLGLILLEALTGRRVFAQISAPEAALARLAQDPVVPSSVGAGWGELLTSMTAREPERRPTALEVLVRVKGLDPPAFAVEAEATVADAASPLVRAADPADESHTRLLPADQPVKPQSSDGPTSITAIETDVAPPSAPTVEAAPSPQRRRVLTWPLAIALAVLLAVAVIVGVAGILPPGVPVPQPSLPATEEPLRGHLQQLLDSVSP